MFFEGEGLEGRFEAHFEFEIRIPTLIRKDDSSGKEGGGLRCVQHTVEATCLHLPTARTKMRRFAATSHTEQQDSRCPLRYSFTRD